MTQYFKTTTIIDGEGNLIATLEDKEITANEVITELAKRHDNNVAPTPLPKAKKEKKTYKKREKVAGIDPKPAKKINPKPVGKRTVVCPDCGEPGHMRKTCPQGAGRNRIVNMPAKTSPTPVAVGEREIDKNPEMLKSLDYDTIRDEFEQGVNIDMLCLTYPDFDRGEIKRAKAQDTYMAYRADYERQYPQ